MIVKESLESLFEMGTTLVDPYDWRKGKCDKLACFYYFETEDGDKYSVRFMNIGEIHNKKKQIWQTEFVIPGDEGTTKVANKGRIFKVISTVIDIIKEFVDYMDPDGLNINPSTNYKGDMRRYEFYLKYIEKLLPEFPNWKKAWSPFDKRILLRKK
jgi:hypothetical protein